MENANCDVVKQYPSISTSLDPESLVMSINLGGGLRITKQEIGKSVTDQSLEANTIRQS